MSKLTLTYFPMGGRAEAIRFALHLGGVDFDDVRIPFPEFGKRKQEGAFPYGSIPTLQVGDFQLAQSNAILRYAGKLTKFYPTDHLEAAKVDELLDSIEDVANLMSPSLTEKDPEVKKKLRETLSNETLPKWFRLIEKRLEKFSGNGTFAVGNSFTVADFKIACFGYWFKSGVLDHIPTTIFDNYKHITAVYNNVYNNEKVKEFVNKHKK